MRLLSADRALSRSPPSLRRDRTIFDLLDLLLLVQGLEFLVQLCYLTSVLARIRSGYSKAPLGYLILRGAPRARRSSGAGYRPRAATGLPRHPHGAQRPSLPAGWLHVCANVQIFLRVGVGHPLLDMPVDTVGVPSGALHDLVARIRDHIHIRDRTSLLHSYPL